jgi:hypothetical protein
VHRQHRETAGTKAIPDRRMIGALARGVLVNRPQRGDVVALRADGENRHRQPASDVMAWSSPMRYARPIPDRIRSSEEPVRPPWGNRRKPPKMPTVVREMPP